MSRTVRELVQLTLLTDRDAVPSETGWVTKCLACRKALLIDPADPRRFGATLEHIVPRSWFGQRAAMEITARLDGPNDPRNLAWECQRCNHGKGSSHDARGPRDARAREVVLTLLARRAERYVPEPETPPASVPLSSPPPNPRRTTNAS